MSADGKTLTVRNPPPSVANASASKLSNMVASSREYGLLTARSGSISRACCKLVVMILTFAL